MAIGVNGNVIAENGRWRSPKTVIAIGGLTSSTMG